MPNVDGGHYFLTVLAPVNTDPVRRPDGGFTVPSHLLREALATLPTARQSPESVACGLQSPFARCLRTHFARFAVLDQPMFNGRAGGDALWQAARGVDLLAHQPVDHLSRPWLIFAADFDARADQADGGLASWAAHLWSVAERELRAVFEHCVKFEDVRDGATFAAWVARCQVDTLMSFNDYYVPATPLPGTTIKRVALGIVGAGLALTLLAALLLARSGGSLWWLLAIAPLALILCAVAGVSWLARRGARPFPTSAGGDLPGVLKSLFVQQRFALLAQQLQGLDDAGIHAWFGEFVAQVRPAETDAPTQPPGVIRSDEIPLVGHARVLAKGAVA